MLDEPLNAIDRSVRRRAGVRAGWPPWLVECRLAQNRARESRVPTEILVIGAEALDVLFDEAFRFVARRDGLLGDLTVIIVEQKVKQLALVADITEDRSGADLGATTDHAQCGRVVTLVGEQRARRCLDPSKPVQLLRLTQTGRPLLGATAWTWPLLSVHHWPADRRGTARSKPGSRSRSVMDERSGTRKPHGS
jgi:hypothetical protein